MPICPNCNRESPKSEFKDMEVSCEDCGSHPAVECPKCLYTTDLVYDDIMEV